MFFFGQRKVRDIVQRFEFQPCQKKALFSVETSPPPPLGLSTTPSGNLVELAFGVFLPFLGGNLKQNGF